MKFSQNFTCLLDCRLHVRFSNKPHATLPFTGIEGMRFKPRLRRWEEAPSRDTSSTTPAFRRPGRYGLNQAARG